MWRGSDAEAVLLEGRLIKEYKPKYNVDFRDDKRFLAHSLIHRNPDGSSRVEYLPVTITRWPPGERVYGR